MNTETITRNKIYKEIFHGKETTTKTYVKNALDYKKYEQVKKYFDGVEPVPGTNGKKYITQDIITKMMQLRD